jgi:hypothetical protein
MPVAAHIDPDSRIVMFRCSGHVAINEARRAFDHMMADPALEGGAAALWDLRGAALAERPRAIPDIVEMLQSRHPERAAGGRFAILVAEEDGPDVSSRVAGSVTSNTLHVRVFSSYAHAARWLGGEDV